jgi:hypothetical protein
METVRDAVAHGKRFYRAEYGVRLKDVDTWEKPRSMEGLLPTLTFVENKEFWGPYKVA